MFRFHIHILLFVLVNSAVFFGQQNYKYENFGDKSIVLNGNVTGSVSDLGATYYNPARLTTITEPLFSVNGKIYQLNVTKIEDFVNSGKTLKSSEFSGLPQMVAGTFQLKNLDNHYFAYSLLSKNRSDISTTYRTGLQNADKGLRLLGIDRYTGTVSIGSKIREEWYGGSWATKLTERFSVGVSVYFSAYEYSGNNNIEYSAITEDSSVALYRSKIGFLQKSYGFLGKVGFSYTFPKVSFGLNINVPYMELIGEGNFNQEEFLSGFDSAKDRFSANRFNDLNAKRKYPLGIQIGSGIRIKKIYCT
ncbi:hypothetical protein P8625_03155 [Tenacibaculum tangerinum]|uniref:DUF5723 domain-containing protein n=1 Tax=Tenacibaculum tangerinum TaxID=3038772 RepID=A0ABY8L425_9FLAO|nr:hypothetical protein [Tenacibaculum tangerinum]WGH76181.1 hypothetical protein P8625_03155 [Tenacibaculum tangerinum]